MTDMVNAPDHYRGHKSGVECIEITEHMPFSAGNSCKYVFRRNDKWNTLEDCRKALWYLKRHVSSGIGSVWLPDSGDTGRQKLANVIGHEPEGSIRNFYTHLFWDDPVSAISSLALEIARIEEVAL